MRVQDLLRKKPADTITIGPHDGLTTAAHLLIAHGIGALPVVSETGRPIGLLSERDIVRAVARNVYGVRNLTVEQSMRTPPPICSADDPIRNVMVRMTRERLRHLIVLEDDRMAGVISVGDLVKDRLDELELETGVLRDYVAARRAV